ncbi:MAG: hypothetical protein OEL89_02625 [Candidatus Peregrinibacteria bacterium]|nr:hypothetical protein [Candidatus Peregrinibacteria bacterium]
MKKITGLSPAKINLTLDVLEKGINEPFHPLTSIYHKISLTDEMTLEESAEFKIVGEFDFPMEQNLIYKAFNLVQKYYSTNTPNVKVSVRKNIPEKGGLGGGSSNFATFVKLYFELFELGEIPAELVKESGNYGKDIPFFFFDDVCAVGYGFGEEIEAVPFSANKFSGQKVWIYCPPFQNCTKESFELLENYNTNFTEKFLIDPVLKNCGNSFDTSFEQEMYSKIIPEEIKNKVHLTGTGACFFSFEKLKIKECKVFEIKFL